MSFLAEGVFVAMVIHALISDLENCCFIWRKYLPVNKEVSYFIQIETKSEIVLK